MEEKKSFKELRLLKKSKSGMLKVIFGRTGINTILILLQFFFYLNMFSYLAYWFPFLFSANVFIQILFIIVIVNTDERSSVQLSWMILTAVAPIYAIPMYYFIKNDIGNRKLKRYTIEYIKKSMTMIPQNEEVIKEAEHDNKKLVNLLGYVNSTGCFPLHGNGGVKYYPVGDDMFPEMLREMKNAKKFIFLEYFILDEGTMWGQMLKILADKVKEGVEVRLIYDGMCEFALLPHNYPKELEKLGIRTRIFSRILPFVSTAYNFRDHRKLLIVDGKTVFTGGINIADEYINKVTRFGHWKDGGIKVCGEAVKNCTLLFLQNWFLSLPRKERRELERDPVKERAFDELFVSECTRYINEIETEERKAEEGYVLPYADNPLDREKVGEMVYVDILNRAKDYVYIMTPYLIIDESMNTALTHTAKKGVRVRIITPHIPDKKIVFANTRSYYKELLDAGVEIYEYAPGFLHSKVFVSDDKRAVTGSINLDYRSLYHNFENAVYVEGKTFAKEVKADFEETFSRCIKIDRTFLEHDTLFNKVAGAVTKPFFYLM